MNETLVRAAGRNVLRMERRFPHPPEKVWRAITEPAQLRAWFPFPVELPELRVGAHMRMRAPDPADDTRAVVTEVDPPRAFAFEWEGEPLRFELRPDGAGTLLVFTHTFDDRAGAPSFATGWETCFDALAAALDGRAFAPPRDTAALLDRYVVALGLDGGELLRDGDGWEVRFERQLARPTQAVWALLTGGANPAVGAAPPPAVTSSAAPGGAVAELDAPRALAYDGPGGHVRWELRDGTGHGARLVLTHRAAGAGADTALAAWRERVAALARALHR